MSKLNVIQFCITRCLDVKPMTLNQLHSILTLFNDIWSKQTIRQWLNKTSDVECNESYAKASPTYYYKHGNVAIGNVPEDLPIDMALLLCTRYELDRMYTGMTVKTNQLRSKIMSIAPASAIESRLTELKVSQLIANQEKIISVYREMNKEDEAFFLARKLLEDHNF
ncbi:hypothetical protein [Vibrio phage BONAISHI]|nr:hypothetical protein [Vibrio phage BONAISHI]